MLLFFLLGFLTEKEIVLDYSAQSPPVVQNRNCVKVLKDGTYLVNAGKVLYHYRGDGSIKNALKPPDDSEINGFTFSKGVYWLSCIGFDEEKNKLEAGIRFFDDQGQYLGVETGEKLGMPKMGILFKFINELDGRVFVPINHLNQNYFYRNPYLFLAREVEYDPTRIALVATGNKFLKISKRQLSLEYNFKMVWIAKKNHRYFVVNQLEPKVFQFDESIIEMEVAQGERVSTQVPFVPLNLPKYREPPEQFFSTNGVVTRAEKNKKMKQWFWSLGLITYFGSLGTGFVISYEIPDYDGSDCVGYHLGILRLDSNFRPVGNLVESEGLMAGSQGGRIHVIHINPQADGGMRPTVKLFQ